MIDGLFHLRDGRVVEQIPWQRMGHKADAYDSGIWP